MEKWEQSLRAQTTESIVSTLTHMQEREQPLVRERARVIGTPAEETVIKELEAERDRIRKLYRGINTKIHANIVIAQLCEIQGQEKQVDDMLSMWRYAQDAAKTLDTRIALCKEILKERRVTMEKRRIGDG